MKDLNTKHHRQLSVEQYKTKLARLMQSYDLFKTISSKSGAGIYTDSNKPLLDDDVWEKLIEEADPKHRGQIKSIREKGFEHETVCSLIAGDTRATGADTCTIEDTLRAIRSETNSPSATNRDGERHGAETTDTIGNDGDLTANQPKYTDTSTRTKPASHKKRLEKVKRIRDGASNEKHGKRRGPKTVARVPKKKQCFRLRSTSTSR